jgi:integrase
MAISPSHPALEGLRTWFAQAWREVERFTVLFERGQVDEWLEAEEEMASSTPAPPPTVMAAPVKAMTMRELLDRFCAIEKPNEENDIRYQFGRLIQFTGDVPITDVGSSQLQDFRAAVARFPRTRLPDIVNLPFPQIVAEYGVDPADPDDEDDEPDGYSPLSPTTVWKWCVNIKRVFQFALESKPTPLTENPAAKLPKKPKASQRGKIRGFNEQEIEALFTKPLFQGCEQVWDRAGATHGYRTKAGDLLVKDARYWLPIVALWQGCRLEEIGFASVEEIRPVEGIQCLDLRQRADNRIKNDQSRRLLPIHPKLVELGFIDYVDQQRANGSDRLFPELPHDLRKVALPKRSTRGVSKWWGLWMAANGFPDREINFHSFRHTFKTICHDLMPEPVHDYLTGHKHARGATTPSVGRGYIHTNVRQAYEAICKVDYPTFPKLP